jgi:hypothetical protein
VLEDLEEEIRKFNNFKRMQKIRNQKESIKSRVSPSEYNPKEA